MEFNTYEDLIQQESKVYERTIAESPEIGWFKQFFEDFQKIIKIIPHKRRKNDLSVNPPTNYLLLTSTLKIIYTSTSILHLISRGYYGLGLNLLRAIQEEYQHMLFFNFHPQDQIKLWNEGKMKSDKINRYMTTSKYIPKKWKGLSKGHMKYHDMLSHFVHPSRLGWSGVVQVEKATGRNIIKLLPIYESHSFRSVFVALMSLLETTLLLLLEIYKEKSKKARIYDEIFQKLVHFESEYLYPTLQNMQLDIGFKMIG